MSPRRTDVEFIEFVPGVGDDGVVAVMDELAASSESGGGGWLTLDPAFDDRFPPPQQTTLGRLVSGRGPAARHVGPRRLGPGLNPFGILHGTGAQSVDRLAEKGIDKPERWRVAADHSKRGLVLWVPIDVPHGDVLDWTCRATRALTRVPLLEQWRVAVHRR